MERPLALVDLVRTSLCPLSKHLAQVGRKSPAAMERRRKQQALDGTGNHSLNSACRRLGCIGHLFVDPRQKQHLAAPWVAKQPSLGTALLVPHGDGPRKGGLNRACLTLTWLASHSQWACLPHRNKNKREDNKPKGSMHAGL